MEELNNAVPSSGSNPCAMIRSAKEKIAKEVLEKLHHLAQMDSELLFRDFKNFGEFLTKVSKVISGAVNIASDTLAEESEIFSEQDREKLLSLFLVKCYLEAVSGYLLELIVLTVYHVDKLLSMKRDGVGGGSTNDTCVNVYVDAVIKSYLETGSGFILE